MQSYIVKVYSLSGKFDHARIVFGLTAAKAHKADIQRSHAIVKIEKNESPAWIISGAEFDENGNEKKY